MLISTQLFASDEMGKGRGWVHGTLFIEDRIGSSGPPFPATSMDIHTHAVTKKLPGHDACPSLVDQNPGSRKRTSR